MPYKCSVTACKGNYDTGPRVSLFRFPTDDTVKKKWLAAIPRENMQVTKNSRVCEVHFHEKDVQRVSEMFNEKTGENISVRLQHPRLKENAIPVIFPGCPSYLTSNSIPKREEPSKRKERSENVTLSAALSKSLETNADYEQKFHFHSLDELLNCMRYVEIPDTWTLVKKIDCISFLNLNFLPHPNVQTSVVIDNNCRVTCYIGAVKLTKLGKFIFSAPVQNIHDVCEILHNVKNLKNESGNSQNNLFELTNDVLSALLESVDEEEKKKVLFAQEQIQLLKYHKTHRRYSTDFLILSTLVHSISPHVYRFLYHCTYLTLPHPSTIKRLCSNFNVNPNSEQSDENLLLYIKDKFLHLKEADHKVVLLMDEIHIKPLLDFKGGNILGMSHNTEGVATTAYVFMIQSVSSPYKDVIHILPVKKMVAELLHAFLLKIITGLEEVGFTVFCISSDNNSINRKAMSYFMNPPQLSIVYPHPVNPQRPLFFIIDCVHILKCLRNNWLNQKNSGVCMYYPDFNWPKPGSLVLDVDHQLDSSNVAKNQLDSSNDNDQQHKNNDYSDEADHQRLKPASLTTLRKLHEIESNSIVKYCPTLTAKALCPSNLERQNVKLVLQIFNMHTIQGIKIAGPIFKLLDFQSTSEFLNIICTWWDIVNVRTIFKGKFKRNVYQEPLRNCNDPKVEFLNSIITWLENWSAVKSDTGHFTKETHLALKHSTYALLEIMKYCCEELNMNYILTGKFQTDSLEARFGLYRQLAGAQYNISMTQVFETETKLRIRSLLPLTLNSHKHGDVQIATLNINDDPGDVNIDENIDMFKFKVSQKDISNVKSLSQILTYLAGYCAHACLKRVKCLYCRNNIILNDLVDMYLDEDLKPFTLVQGMDRGGLKYPCDEIVTIVTYNYVIVTKLLSAAFEKDFMKLKSQRAAVHRITKRELNVSEIYLPVEICINGHKADDLTKLIVSSATNIFLKNYCKKVNDTLIIEKNEAKCKKRKLQTLEK